MIWGKRQKKQHQPAIKAKRSMQCGIASLRHWTKKPLYMQWLAANDVNPIKKHCSTWACTTVFFSSFLCTALCQLRCAIAVTVYTTFTLIFPGCCFRHIHSHMENGFAVFERANLFVIHRQTIPQVVVHCVYCGRAPVIWKQPTHCDHNVIEPFQFKMRFHL